MSHERLGLRADGASGIVPIDVLLHSTHAVPFPVTYQAYSDNAVVDNLGKPIKSGPPRVHWHWDWLPQADIDVLLSFEGQVYVRSRKNTGVRYEYAVFAADMLEPVIGDMILLEDNDLTPYGQRRGPVDIDFINLVEEQVGSSFYVLSYGP